MKNVESTQETSFVKSTIETPDKNFRYVKT